MDYIEQLKAKLENGKEMAYISKFLATINCEAPIGKCCEDFEYRGIDSKVASLLFLKLEFESLLKKFNIEIDPSLTQGDSSVISNKYIKYHSIL